MEVPAQEGQLSGSEPGPPSKPVLTLEHIHNAVELKRGRCENPHPSIQGTPIFRVRKQAS